MIPALDTPDNALAGLGIAGLFTLGCLAVAAVAVTIAIATAPRRPRHQCPARGCTRTVRDDRLMCGPHWRLVPAHLQRAVTDAWRGGEGRGTVGHYAAMAAAVVAANRARRACQWCRPISRYADIGALPSECTCKDGDLCEWDFCQRRAVTR